MIAVSPGYEAVQKSSEFKPARKVFLYRRLADGSGWESSPLDVTAEVLNLGRLSDKLDTDDLNVYKIGNLSITVENSNQQWDQGSSRFSGYLFYRSKLVIELGLAVNGPPETFPRFTGFIEDHDEDADKPALVLQVNSSTHQLETADAHKAGLLSLNELLGTGDGVNPDFYTQQSGVDEALAARVAGLVQRPGLQWTISQLRDPALRAKVSFPVTQPGPGLEVRADYRYWRQNITIEQAVADLMATVPAVPVSLIQPVDFATTPALREILHTTFGDFSGYLFQRTKAEAEPEPPTGDARLTLDPIDTEAEWTGLRAADSKINYKRVPNAIHPRWPLQYEGDYLPQEEYQQVEGEPILPRWWTEFLPTGATHSVAGSILHVRHPGGADYFINGERGGGYSQSRYFAIRIRFQSLSDYCYYGGRASLGSLYGAVLQFDSLVGSNPALGRVRLTSAGNSPWTMIDLSAWHTFEVVMDSVAMQARLYIDGSSTPAITTALGSPSATSGGSVQFQSTSGGVNEFDIDFMRFNHEAAEPPTGSITLQISYYPHLAGLTTFGLITTLGPFRMLWQGTYKSCALFYSWSEDGSTWSAEVPLAIGANIGNWTNVNAPMHVRVRINMQPGISPQPFAVTQLWLPGIAAGGVNGGSATTSWNNWLRQYAVNDGQARFFTAAEAPSMTGWSFYANLGSGDAIMSDDMAVAAGYPVPARLAFVTLLNTSGANPPTHQESLFRLTTGTIFLTLANYGHGSVLSVITELAGIADAELGVNGAGAFFFRDKHAGTTPVRTLDDSNVLDVLSCSPGWDRVFNSVKAEFGPFRYIADSASESDPAPTSERRFGTRSLPLGGGNLMFQQDVDLATVMARRYWTRYKEPKRRLTVKTRWMPEVELGDRVVYDVQKPRRIGPSHLDARVIGVALDAMGFTTEIELMEV